MFVNNSTISKFQIENFGIFDKNNLKLSKQVKFKNRIAKTFIDLFAKHKNQSVKLLNSSDFNSHLPHNKVFLDSNSTYNILILRYDAIGDYLATTPLIELIKSKFQNSKVDIICSERNFQLISKDNNINYIYKIKSNDSLTKIYKELKTQRKSNANIKYDLIISPIFTQFTKATLIASIFQSENTDGIMFLHNKKFQIYSSVFNYQLIKNYAEISNFDVIKQFYLYFDSNYKLIDCNKKGYIPENNDLNIQNQTQIKNYFTSNNLFEVRYIVINISAFTTERNLSRDFVIELLDYINENYLLVKNIHLFLISSPRDYSISNEIIDHFDTKLNKNIHNFQSDFMTIIELIKYSSLVISPDTSIIHIASIYDKPVLGFYVDKHKIIEWQPYKTQFSAVLSKSNKIMDIDFAESIEAFEDLICRTNFTTFEYNS